MKLTVAIAAALVLAGACKNKEEPKQETPPPAAKDAAAAPVATELAVTPTAPAIGDTITRTEDSRTTMKIGGAEIEETEKLIAHTKVVAVVPPAVAKVEVRYETHDVTRRSGSQQETAPSPLAGKTYLVGVEGDKLVATGPGGEKVGDSERELLEQHHLELGKVPEIEQVVRSRRWKLNQRVDLGSEELLSLGKARSGGDDTIQPKSGWLTWTGTDGDLAIFEGEMTVTKEDDRARVESTLTTTLRLDPKNGRIHEMLGRGTMKGEVKGAEPSPIEGSLDVRTQYTYAR